MVKFEAAAANELFENTKFDKGFKVPQSIGSLLQKC